MQPIERVMDIYSTLFAFAALAPGAKAQGIEAQRKKHLEFPFLDAGRRSGHGSPRRPAGERKDAAQPGRSGHRYSMSQRTQATLAREHSGSNQESRARQWGIGSPDICESNS